MLLHGEAIAIGMLHAARLSTQLQRAGAADADRLQALLARFGLPTSIPPGVDPQHLLDLMRLDKKNVSGRLRLILWRGIGQAEIVPDVDAAAILRVLGEG
jgi:3-dehydroquinate synthase